MTSPSRPGGLAAGITVIAAIALSATVVGRSCRVTEVGPDEAVRDMFRAAKAGERELVYQLLGPKTQARLAQHAENASHLVGTAVRYTPLDMIMISPTDSSHAPSDITIIDETDTSARVEVVSPAGRSQVELLKLDGRWRIELPGY